MGIHIGLWKGIGSGSCLGGGSSFPMVRDGGGDERGWLKGSGSVVENKLGSGNRTRNPSHGV